MGNMVVGESGDVPGMDIAKQSGALGETMPRGQVESIL